LEFQAIKYKEYMRWIVKTIHPKPANDEVSKIFGWVVDKKDPPSDRARIRDMIAKKEIAGNEALARAIDCGLPWEIVRANVSLDSVDASLFREAVRKIFSGFDIAMQLATIVRKLGIDEALKVVSSRLDHIPLAPLYRATVGILLSDRYSYETKSFARKLEEIARPRAEEVLSRFKSVVKSDIASRIIALIDVSGSMMGRRIRAVVEMLAPIYRAIDRFYVFSGEGFAGMRFEEVVIRSVDDVVGLTLLPRGGTPLWDALRTVGTIARREDAMLLVFTDEQENVSTSTPLDVEEVLKDVPTIVVNPAPYPTDFIPKERGKIVGLPGSDINAVLAGARILELQNIVQTEGRIELDALAKLGYISI